MKTDHVGTSKPEEWLEFLGLSFGLMDPRLRIGEAGSNELRLKTKSLKRNLLVKNQEKGNVGRQNF